MTWQPIETAPLDGTPVLLRVEGVTIEGRFDARKGEWLPGKLPSHGCGCCGADDDPPTHWMPLPDSP